jgi:hypothetical protein
VFLNFSEEVYVTSSIADEIVDDDLEPIAGRTLLEDLLEVFVSKSDTAPKGTKIEICHDAPAQLVAAIVFRELQKDLFQQKRDDFKKEVIPFHVPVPRTSLPDDWALRCNRSRDMTGPVAAGEPPAQGREGDDKRLLLLAGTTRSAAGVVTLIGFLFAGALGFPILVRFVARAFGVARTLFLSATALLARCVRMTLTRKRGAGAQNEARGSDSSNSDSSDSRKYFFIHMNSQ